MLFEVSTLSTQGRERLRVEALSENEAADIARARGLTVLGVRPARHGRLWPTRARRPFPLLLFSRELMALLNSGLTLVEALQTLEEKDPHSPTSSVVSALLKQLYAGQSFSTALTQLPESFPPLYAATVRASEQTGDIAQALARFVSYQGQLEQVRSKAFSAAIYPLMLLAVGTLVALFLLGFVTPRFAAIYADNMQALPWASRLLVNFGSLLEQHALGFALTLLLTFSALFRASRQPAVRLAIVQRLWKLPGLGERLRVFQLTRFYRTTGMLLSGGIPMVTALEMAGDLLHLDLKPRLRQAITALREGQPVSAAMEQAALTTPVASRMLRVGERSGRMGEMMEAIAAFHDEETSRFVDWFTRLFEPLLMLGIGLVIGLIVVLLYLPIFELAGSLE